VADLTHITRNLRPRDKEELFATRFGDDPEAFASSIAQTGSFQWGVYLDGVPVAAIGAMPRWPGVWSMWAFGTDDWPKVALTLTRHVRRFMIPALLRAGAHRADAAALATHTDARRWLEAVGAKPENVLDKYGRNGETFVLYVWTRETAKAATTRSQIRPRP
jgi:hypothetical protein